MPLYEFQCDNCDKTIEVLARYNDAPPVCCETFMRRFYGSLACVKVKYPMWVDRIDDIHKAQEQKGERLRIVHPKEVMA